MSYNADSIQQLSFVDACRTRIGIYLGSADHTGVLAGLLELVNNATDEAIVCPDANKIEITIGKDWAACRDYGRGMPHGPNDFSKEIMINLLTENHSGAKFNDQAYGGKTRGLNGTGSSATCCSSDWFEITSYRDGAAWYMRFEKGIPQFPVCQKSPLNGAKQGTYIKYKPSQEVFASEPIYFDYNEICEIIKQYSYFNKGVTFSVVDAESNTSATYCSKNGILDFVNEKAENPLHKPIYIKATENEIDVELILQWTTGKEQFYLFSNGGENPNGGTPITGIRTALTNFFKKYERNGDIAKNGLLYCCSVNLKNPIYDGQTKSKITNPELRGLCQKLTTRALTNFAETAPKDFEKVLNYVDKLGKAEIAAEKARQSIIRSNKEIERNIKKKVFASDKLKDARKLGQDSILLICEGDSALGSLSQARDPNQYGLLGIRGKIINAMSNPLDKVLENEEVQLIYSALGITPGDYNVKKMRYGKIGIASDSDKDGNHIALLLLSLFATLSPKLLEEKRIFRLIGPTHIITKAGKNYYFFSEDEYNNHVIDGDVKFIKGLGALNPSQMKESMFGGKQQRTFFEWTATSKARLESLMGTDIEPRREYLFNKVDFSTITE